MPPNLKSLHHLSKGITPKNHKATAIFGCLNNNNNRWKTRNNGRKRLNAGLRSLNEHARGRAIWWSIDLAEISLILNIRAKIMNSGNFYRKAKYFARCELSISIITNLTISTEYFHTLAAARGFHNQNHKLLTIFRSVGRHVRIQPPPEK